MMHYRKGENVEHEIERENLPFDDCLKTPAHRNFLWMHVKGGTKVNNVITFAKNALDNGEYRSVVWSGSGGGVVKTISCAEIMKRTHPLYQVSRMCYTSVEEHWLPQMSGLEEIVANRQIPSLHILMSLDAFDDDVSGLQKPNTKTDFWLEPRKAPGPQGSRRGNNNGQNRQTPQQRQRPHQSMRNDDPSKAANGNQQEAQDRPQRKPQNKQQRNPQRKRGGGGEEGAKQQQQKKQGGSAEKPMDTS